MTFQFTYLGLFKVFTGFEPTEGEITCTFERSRPVIFQSEAKIIPIPTAKYKILRIVF